MTAAQFRRIALGMTDAIEAAHMGHPDFRINGRIFATLHDGNTTGMVKLTPEQQARFVREYPDAFSLEAGAWGRSGSTRVHLGAADEDTLGEAMTLAWQDAVSKGPTRSSNSAKRTRAAKSTRNRATKNTKNTKNTKGTKGTKT